MEDGRILGREDMVGGECIRRGGCGRRRGRW